ncbi:hypothetical protein ACSTD9_22685, partial [Vibrio vulnificus]
LVRFVIVPPVVYEVHSNTSNQVAKLTMPLQAKKSPHSLSDNVLYHFATNKTTISTEESPDDLDKNHQVKVDAHLVM